MSWLVVYVTVGWVVRATMVPVILRRQLAPGAAVAWLGIIFLHPYIGLTLYLTIGETRLGPHRVERHRSLVAHYRGPLCTGNAARCQVLPDLETSYEPMVLQAEKISGMPVMTSNAAEFIGECPALVDRLVADIDAAQSQVHLLYYIFAPDETGRRVAAAVEGAVRRGVVCRVLADAVASRTFFRRRGGMARQLRAAGVQVAAALPAAPIQRRLPRMDLRNHRKLSVIDGRVAFVGSHNLVNADYGGRRGGPWVDLTGRLTGPVVRELAIVFAEDWAFETGQMLEVPSSSAGEPLPGGVAAQVIPTGPTSQAESFRRALLGALQCARNRAVLTTPYFVPDEPTLVALLMAADRGVEVSLVLPRVPDHLFTAAAGRAHFGRLLNAGVQIYLYRPGLIHAKTTTIDDTLAIFGSANLDVRSFNLNFELNVILYGREIAGRVSCIQQRYVADSYPLNPATWSQRSAVWRYADSAVSLLSPLL